jgi:RNA methyltransferase, TrmH family
METITSKDNPTVKAIIRLRRANQRRKHDLVVVEGIEELALARSSGLKIDTFIVCPDLAPGLAGATERDAQNLAVSAAVFKRMSIRERPDGVLGLVVPKPRTLPDLVLPESPLILILEGLEKPGNIGAIVRTADAAGVSAVIVADAKTDVYNPNVIRASRGAVFAVPVVAAPSDAVADWLQANRVRVIAATPHAESEHTAADYRGAVAIAVGTEHEGLSRRWLDLAETKVRIAMRGTVDSLNASVSAAVIVFEAVRQRRA